MFVDIQPDTYTLAPEALPAALTEKTKAVLPVHLYGLPARMDAILAFAQRHGLMVIEDCAQAHGAEWRNPAHSEWQKVGTLGDAAAFSFYPTKNLGGFGDGGCVVTNHFEIAEKVRLMRQYGWRKRQVSSIAGWNSRLDELQAAVLKVKLRVLDDWNQARREIAVIYDEILGRQRIIRPGISRTRAHVFHQYVIRTTRRDEVRRTLSDAGISTAIHYPIPVHMQPAYRVKYGGVYLPVTETICPEILSLPMYPQLGAGAAEKVARSLDELLYS